mgnify:CR=1 FL=1
MTKEQSWVEQAESTVITKGSDREQVEMSGLVVFTVNSQQYAIAVEHIKEVIHTPPITPLPQSPDLLGVCNVRGTVIAVMDMYQKITKKDAESLDGFILILENEDLKVGVLVDQIPESTQVESQKINTSAAALKSLDNDERFITGVVRTDERFIFLIDPFLLIN